MFGTRQNLTFSYCGKWSPIDNLFLNSSIPDHLGESCGNIVNCLKTNKAVSFAINT